MKLKDLEPGMVVELANGRVYTIVLEAGELKGRRKGGWIAVNPSRYNEDMVYPQNQYNIVKVTKEEEIIYDRNKQKRKRQVKFNKIEQLTPEKIWFADPFTTVLWPDGTKTTVRCTKEDKFSEEFGLAMATLKRVFGNNHRGRMHYMRVIKRAYHSTSKKPLKKLKKKNASV